MKLCSSPIAMMLGAVLILLATRNYALHSDFFADFDSALEVGELVLIALGLLSLRMVKNSRRVLRRCGSLRVMNLSKQSRPMEPIIHSNKGFCYGERGAETPSSIKCGLTDNYSEL